VLSSLETAPPLRWGRFAWASIGRIVGRSLAVDTSGASPVAAAPMATVHQVIRRFWPYARPYRPWLALTLLFVVLAPATETAAIWIFKLLVDDVLVPHDLGRLGPIALGYLVITLSSGIVEFGDKYLSTWIGERFLFGLRTSIFRHLQSLSLDFFDRQQLGDIVSRLTGDVGAIETFVLSGVADLLAYVLRIIFFTAALFYLQWQLALVALTVSPVMWLLARRFSMAVKVAAREKRRRAGSISAVAQESLAHVVLVQAYNRQADEAGRFARQALASMQAQLASARLKALFAPMVDLAQMTGTLLVVGTGTWYLAQGQLSLGGLLVFLAYLGKLYSPIRGLGNLANTAFAASASAERVIEVLDEQPHVVESSDARPLVSVRGYVEFQAVSFTYPGATQPALDRISFRVQPGEVLALVGASGAGKSTIARLLLRFYDPTAGRVLLDGRDLRTTTLPSLREQVTLLLQETLIFDGTVRDNIAFGRPDATEAEIVEAARAADAHEFITSLPNGYDSCIGQQGRRLSGGQRQRIAIARALIRDAPVLILDEPTTGLDGRTSARIFAPLRRLMSGRTTVLISHSVASVRAATSVLVLDRGRAVERGSYADLLAGGQTFTGLFEPGAALVSHRQSLFV
jgi:ABC-type multidrug transport system fused ATPase/permease subunit